MQKIASNMIGDNVDYLQAILTRGRCVCGWHVDDLDNGVSDRSHICILGRIGMHPGVNGVTPTGHIWCSERVVFLTRNIDGIPVRHLHIDRSGP